MSCRALSERSARIRPQIQAFSVGYRRWCAKRMLKKPVAYWQRAFLNMITIVDCGINNLRSVQKAFEHLGHQTQITRDAGEIASAEKIVLPGVGAFGAAMKSLH